MSFVIFEILEHILLFTYVYCIFFDNMTLIILFIIIIIYVKIIKITSCCSLIP